MIENQKKCIQLLESLDNMSLDNLYVVGCLGFDPNSKALTILESLLDKTKNNPNDNLHGYVDEALTLMQSKEFKDSLTTLSNQYSRKEGLFLIGEIVAIAVLAVSTALLGHTLIMMAPLLLSLFIGGLLYAGLMELSAAAKHLDSRVIPLVTGIPKEYSLDASYTYDQKESASGGDIVTVETVFHPSTSIAAVKASFFQKVDGHSSLAEEVQEKFTSLAQAVGAK